MSAYTHTMLRIEAPINALTGVGPGVASRLQRLNIFTIRDLLFHIPRRYLDLTNPIAIKNLTANEAQVVAGTLDQINTQYRRGTLRNKNTIAQLIDDEGNTLPITWFNQAFLARTLKNGERVLLYGTPRWDFRQKTLTFWNPRIERAPKIIPIYPETEGINSRFLAKLIKNALSIVDLDDFDLGLDLSLKDALWQVHIPQKLTQAKLARDILSLYELIFLHCLLIKQNRSLARFRAPQIKPSIKKLQKFVTQLPFTLTPGQKRAAWQIIQNLNQVQPMNRLLEGDVGTGKTLVAALAAVSVLDAGLKVIWMAPTQVLAQQLFVRLETMIKPFNIPVRLVTAQSRKSLPRGAALLVGTHALINLTIKPKELGLVIVDEQHRFGVKQRRALLPKDSMILPHVLTMTATPIPRSLALSLYGDLELSMLKDRPFPLHPVKTMICSADKRHQIAKILQQELSVGRQGFIVAPRIEGIKVGRIFDTLSLKTLHEIYQKLLPQAKLSIYHGKMGSDQKKQVINDFEAKKIDLLVATSIIEVGIDMPNATVIVIEEAECFGLAQLHQLRGRVGRAQHSGTCILVPNVNHPDHQRLNEFINCNDGFELAEIDLRYRGPGDLLGTQQSGLPALKIADLTNVHLNQKAKKLARSLLDNESDDLQRLNTLFNRAL